MATPVDATRIAFAAISTPLAHTLVLGSMPGVASLDQNQYYAHPRNAFWPIMCSFFNTDATDYGERIAMLENNGLALWDVIASCQRKGSLDSNIEGASVVCNDFAGFLAAYPQIKNILLNGKTAEKLFRKHALTTIDSTARGVPTLHVLPSTSPAMASLNLEQKKQRWHATLSRCFSSDTQDQS